MFGTCSANIPRTVEEAARVAPSALEIIYSIFLEVSEDERLARGLARGDNPEIIKSRIAEDKEIFTEDVRKSCNFVIRDLKREDIDEVIQNNLPIFFTET